MEKIFRIVYWFNSVMTERYIKARDEKHAREKFVQMYGYEIIRIEETK